jgi:hypothetical protein
MGCRQAGVLIIILDNSSRQLEERDMGVDCHWHVLSPRRLADELTAAGYGTSLQEMDVVVATPRN